MARRTGSCTTDSCRASRSRELQAREPDPSRFPYTNCQTSLTDKCWGIRQNGAISFLSLLDKLVPRADTIQTIDLAVKLGAEDETLDYLGVFLGATTNYCEHTGIQAVLRHLVERAAS